MMSSPSRALHSECIEFPLRCRGLPSKAVMTCPMWSGDGRDQRSPLTEGLVGFSGTSPQLYEGVEILNSVFRPIKSSGRIQCTISAPAEVGWEWGSFAAMLGSLLGLQCERVVPWKGEGVKCLKRGPEAGGDVCGQVLYTTFRHNTSFALIWKGYCRTKGFCWFAFFPCTKSEMRMSGETIWSLVSLSHLRYHWLEWGIYKLLRPHDWWLMLRFS